jgi:hypothetical protein
MKNTKIACIRPHLIFLVAYYVNRTIVASSARIIGDITEQIKTARFGSETK